MTDPQISQAPSDLEPPQLMDMILCDARGYSIKFAATRKRNDNKTKEGKAQQLKDAVTLLEVDDGQDPN